MDLSDVSESKYLASADYQVGTVLGPGVITKVTREPVPVPGKKEQKEKTILYVSGFTKPYAANHNVARLIGSMLGVTDIDKTWVGCSIALRVVGDVRRPDGTKGNAFRLESASKASPAQEEAKKLYLQLKAKDAAKADEIKAKHGQDYAAMIPDFKVALG